MAARILKIRHDGETRAKIKTTLLARRLTLHALGKLDLSQTQVRAIEILLRKTLPDLAVTELKHTSADGTPIGPTIVNQYIEMRRQQDAPVVLLEPPSDSRH